MDISFDCTHDCTFCAKELCDERIESVDIVDIEQFLEPFIARATPTWRDVDVDEYMQQFKDDNYD